MFAHERNISFNELVEEALVNAIPSIEKVVKKRKLHDE
jgi:hypothetical protein